MRFPILFIVLMTAISACNTNQMIVEDDISVDFEVLIGESFSMNLKSNPTTGYSWYWVNKENVEIVDSINYKYHSDNPHLIGSGGVESWSFKGVEKGIDTLRFEYIRPWEKEDPADETIIVVKVY